MLGWLHTLYSQAGTQQLIATGGLLALNAIIFAETGLFLGFFLPGDSLLLTAGVCCKVDPLSPGGGPLLPLGGTLLSLFLAASLGNVLNFWLGRSTGGAIRERPDSRFFKRRHLAEAEVFFQRWGGWAVVAGRFVPIIRTFVPFAAGMSGMRWVSFLWWSLLGAALWVGLMVGLGFALAHSQALVQQLHLLVLAIILLSFVPVGLGLMARWRRGPAAT